MKLSTRTRYGIRAILELAGHYKQGPLQISVIAKRQDISVKYLEQLMMVLRSGGFVKSIRGSKGGYILAKAPNQIKLDEIFNCLEGPVTTVECVKDENYCGRFADCMARDVWVKVQEAITGVLRSISLQDLIEKAKGKEGVDYRI